MSGIKVLLGKREIGIHPINKDSVILGRAPEVDVFIPNLAVSRKHGRIFKKDGRWFYEDLCSTNGTYINTSKITLCQLNEGTELIIGKCRIIFTNSVQNKDKLSAAYSIDIKKLLDEDTEKSQKRRIDETIKFDRTTVIKLSQSQNGNKKKQISPIAYIEFVDTKEKINIDEEEIFFGKSPECRIKINGLLISHKHAKLEFNGEEIKLISLKNFPSVSVNGVKITERILKNDDYIDIGSYRFRIRFL